MAICKLNRNLTRANNCDYSLPEVVEIYMINYDDLSAATLDEGTGTSEGCDAISNIELHTGANAFKIVPAKKSASFEDTLVVEDNGNKYRNASLTFNVTGSYNACMHGALDALSLGRYFVVLKLADGGYIALGRISPIEAETATLAGGGDSNGMQIVLSGNIAESPLPLTDAAITALKAVIAE